MDKRAGCRCSSKCRGCYNADYRKRHAEHPETSIRYRANHREKLLADKKEYYLKNTEHCKKLSKEYYETHRESLRKASKEWVKNNPEKVKASCRKRYENHKEHILKVAKAWKDSHRDAVNTQWQRREAKKKSLIATLTKEQWEAIKNEFDNCCAYCGEKKPLTQDHFVPVSKDGEYTTNNIIPACSKCNCNKFNNSFFTWYPTFKYYSKKREQHILIFLGYKDGIQQLRLDEV